MTQHCSVKWTLFTIQNLTGRGECQHSPDVDVDRNDVDVIPDVGAQAHNSLSGPVHQRPKLIVL